MKLIKKLIVFGGALVLFFVTYKVMTTIGIVAINKLEIDLNTELGRNIVAGNTIIWFIISTFLAIKFFKARNLKS